jgi:Na+/melibiose symporter-like transporter
MDITDRFQKPVFATYLAWTIVLLIHAVVVTARSDWLATLLPDTSQFVMTMFLAMFGVLMISGAILAWFTQAHRWWARWLFMALCLAYAADCLLGTFAVGPLHENMTRPYSIFRGPISFAIWGYLVWLAWSTRPNHAVKRDAPQAARPLP